MRRASDQGPRFVNLAGTVVGFVLAVFAHPSPAASTAPDFKGFWKPDCTEAFGIRITPADNGLWSVAYCGPGGCFTPSTWLKNSTIVGDPRVEVRDDGTLVIRETTYRKCTSETDPKLDYSSSENITSPRVVQVDVSAGLPDYEAQPSFVGHDSATIHSLHALVTAANPDAAGCTSGSVRVSEKWRLPLHSNVCTAGELTQIRSLVGQLAPSLHSSHLGFWVTATLTGDEPVLLVTHIDLTPDAQGPYPFLNLWRVKFEGDDYSARHAGAFLNGRIRSIRPFGEHEGRQIVFVEHVNCIECEPTVYVTPIDFEAEGDARPYESTYDKDHQSYDETFEFALPGMGHTVAATTETRTLSPSTSGPHLLQHFHMLEPGQPDEWWTFTCRSYRCDYKLDTNRPSAEFMRLWTQARRL